MEVEMLILTRKVDERIHIGNDITITVVRIAGGRVQIGIEAPSNVRVLRGDLADTGGNERALPPSSCV
jgi:carbon storage regulator CsrA